MERIPAFYLHRHIRRQTRKKKPKLAANRKKKNSVRRKIEKRHKIQASKIAWRFEYFGNKCWMCGGAAQSVDHVIPISKKGRAVQYASNMRPACNSCNRRKGDKDLADVIQLCQRMPYIPNLP